jgi:hypothetical protein
MYMKQSLRLGLCIFQSPIHALHNRSELPPCRSHTQLFACHHRLPRQSIAMSAYLEARDPSHRGGPNASRESGWTERTVTVLNYSDEDLADSVHKEKKSLDLDNGLERSPARPTTAFSGRSGAGHDVEVGIEKAKSGERDSYLVDWDGPNDPVRLFPYCPADVLPDTRQGKSHELARG